MKSRAATTQDVQAISRTLAGAFANDPVWSWAFSDVDQLEVWWRFWVAAAVPQGEVRLTEHAEAVAVWLPPGGFEVPPEDEAHVEPLLRGADRRARALVQEVLDSFEEHHPDGDYYYLTLFGTAPEHRGQGSACSCSPRTSRRSTRSTQPRTSSRATR